MIYIKSFLESVENNDVVNEVEDFFVYSHLDKDYDIEAKELTGGGSNLQKSIGGPDLVKIVLLNINKKGIKDVMEDIKPVVSRMENFSHYAVSLIIFTGYGFHTDYQNIRKNTLGRCSRSGPGLSSLINVNDNTEERIVLFIYKKD
jgi:hypothetical protein